MVGPWCRSYPRPWACPSCTPDLSKVLCSGELHLKWGWPAQSSPLMPMNVRVIFSHGSSMRARAQGNSCQALELNGALAVACMQRGKLVVMQCFRLGLALTKA